MLIGLMNFLALVYYWSWFFWPLAFISSLIRAITRSVQGEDDWVKSMLIAAGCLMVILAGLTAPNFR